MQKTITASLSGESGVLSSYVMPRNTRLHKGALDFLLVMKVMCSFPRETWTQKEEMYGKVAVVYWSMTKGNTEAMANLQVQRIPRLLKILLSFLLICAIQYDALLLAALLWVMRVTSTV